jgi:purine-binding chemotaxis protein CheW
MTGSVQERDTHEHNQQVVSCKLGAEEYGIDVVQVQEIVRLTAITAVPRSPHYVEGVINLRGRIVPIIDLAKRFGLPSRERTAATRIMIVRGGGGVVGMLVDSVREVIHLAPGAVMPAPELLLNGINSDFITGIATLGDRLLIMLNLPKVLSTQEYETLEQELSGLEA